VGFARLILLLGILTALFLGIGYFFAGIAGMGFGLIIAFFMNFIAYWYSDSFVLKLYRAKQINEKDYDKLSGFSELVKKAEIDKPKLYIIETDAPNAFATGRSYKHSAVAVTTGLLSRLDKNEIESVISHELGHIKHRDTLLQTMTATMAGALSWFAYLFAFGDSENRNILSVILLMIFVPLAASLIRLAVSRNREFAADRYGAMLSSPLGLASALEKIDSFAKAKPTKGNSSTAHLFIVNPFSGGALVSLFSTHPSTASRVAKLREMNK
jgi:heat shock protein HtpX